MRLDIQDNNDGVHRVTLEDLQDELSTLHVLAVTKASLKMVRLAYEDDPSALTEDVFHDACEFCYNLEVLKFLKEHVAPEAYTPEKIAPIMMNVIRRWDTMDYERPLEILSTLFPEAVTYPEDQSFDSSYCLQLATNDTLSDELLDLMLDGALRFTHNVRTFSLSYDVYYGKSIVKKMMLFLSKSMVESFQCEYINWNNSREFVECLEVLFQGANMKTLELKVPEKESAEPDVYASFPLDCLNTSQISNLSLCFYGESKDNPDFGMLQLLVHMKQLKSLILQIKYPGQADHDFCETICQILLLGRLESLTVVAADEGSRGVLFPLLATASATPSLTEFNLRGLESEKWFDAYQDRMVQLLESNTTMTDVKISRSSDYVIWGEKLIQIRYFTRLNRYGRGLARGSGRASDMVKILEEASGHEAESVVPQLLYGLLRESPGTWSADVLGQDPSYHCGGGQKRKASCLPV